MEQKRVSFEVAKAIKEAGYPQKCHGYTKEGYKVNPYILSDERTEYAAPTCLDVWLWLWREKKIETEIYNDGVGLTAQVRIQGRPQFFTNDPEEAIITAIGYLVDNDLIK